MFKRLSTKLTVVYAGLFGVALLAVATIVYAVIADNAARIVRNELAANGEVFDRVWSLRDAQLRDSADILSRDFGFREAVATLDAPTIESALDNLRDRLQIDRAFMMTLNGEVVGASGVTTAELDALWSALDNDERASGVLMLDGHAYQAVSAPIRAPDLVGWIIFASELNAAHLDSFEQLSAIPLNAAVFTRAANGGWASTDVNLGARDLAGIGAELAQGRAGVDGAPRRWRLQAGAVVAVTRPLRAFDRGDANVLVLTYPLALALRPYEPILTSIVLVGLFGIGLLVFGSWVLARGLTRPIAALDDATQALQRGERVHVTIETSDEIGRLALSFNNMSNEIDERQRRITHMALHDSDTGLPNRRSLQAALDKGGAKYVVAFAIQRYATIRNAVGYALMVELVRCFGDKLSEAAGEAPYGRLPGDSLAICIEVDGDQDALDWAEKVRAELEGSVRVGGVSVDVSLVAGVARTGENGDHASLDHALIAVTQAIAHGAKCALFDSAAYGDPARNLSLMSDMIGGINKGDLELHYQPKYDLRAGSIVGVEALVRWNHPTRGRVAPDLFVTMAEDTGNIAVLTEWTLIQAIAHQQKLRSAGHDLLVSVNLSGSLIGDDEFAAMVISLIEDHGAALCLEITETAAMKDAEAALRNIDRYIAAGVHISIDDYGAGLSSLSYLKRIRAHELKLDKSFIQALDANSREALLVKSTVDLAHGLGMKITAEGVETASTLALLAGMGCDIAQGYFLDRPMPIGDLLARLNSNDAKGHCRAIQTTRNYGARAPHRGD